MKKAVCPGSFDPVTLGHVDIIRRAAGIFDEVIVGVFYNIQKKAFLPVEKRVELLQSALQEIPNVRVCAFSGLLADFLQQEKAHVLVRGIRNLTDLEYEKKQAQMMQHLLPEAETMFLLAKPEYEFISSSAVKELIKFKGSIRGLVPHCVEVFMEECRNFE